MNYFKWLETVSFLFFNVADVNFSDSVFWIEEQFPTGRRVLFQKIKDEAGIIEWSPPNVSVRNRGCDFLIGSN